MLPGRRPRSYGTRRARMVRCPGSCSGCHSPFDHRLTLFNLRYSIGWPWRWEGATLGHRGIRSLPKTKNENPANSAIIAP
ncbi:hypothetical protein ebA5743 [Aromatoleum aromaticum EbN1]|uniref:Uncharacterized protein n=1 Tax=Aromatoleum aromaticum (strain DSM 19018 / LMG 30748 / EbN1) TaxID=76114 RepID=Q5NZX7_AROAE|nr:hypothetical protein ebA5743 [Aromatoleum aromaticum EbN1]